MNVGALRYPSILSSFSEVPLNLIQLTGDLYMTLNIALIGFSWTYFQIAKYIVSTTICILLFES